MVSTVNHREIGLWGCFIDQYDVHKTVRVDTAHPWPDEAKYILIKSSLSTWNYILNNAVLEETPGLSICFVWFR
jgi:hypothetical protein